MKSILLYIIGIVLFSLNSNAQGKGADQKLEFIYGSLITTFNREIIEYKFKSLEELNEGVDEITKEFDFDSSEKGKTCEMKMEIKIELASGITKILISEIINTGCDNELLSAVANRLKTIALATRS